MRRVKPVHVMAHPSFYQAMEELNKKFKEKNGFSLSQTESTRIIAQNLRAIKIPDIFQTNKKEVRKRI